MLLTKYSHRVPDLFDRFFENELFDWANRDYSNTNTTVPSVNIKESDSSFEVTMAAPGLSKADFNVEVNHNVLTISSEKKTENEATENERFTRREYSYQSFSRSFTLPNTVEGDKIKAKYEDGILTVHLPKRQEAIEKKIRKIDIA